jgi:hypothetical protein
MKNLQCGRGAFIKELRVASGQQSIETEFCQKSLSEFREEFFPIESSDEMKNSGITS